MTATTEQKDWTITITPEHRLFDLNLKEVWSFRSLIMLLVRRDFVVSYKQTFLGPFWVFIQPLVITLIYTLVFGYLVKIPTNGLPPVLFFMSGVVAWSFLADCINNTSTTFLGYAPIFGKVYFPRLVVPISMVLNGLIRFGIQLLILTVLVLYFARTNPSVRPGSELLFLPLLVSQILFLGFGTGVFISAVTTKYRDLAHLVAPVLMVWMYASPVIYPLSLLPDSFQAPLSLNPVVPMIENLRCMFLGGEFPGLPRTAMSVISTVIILLIGLTAFKRAERSFIDTI